ncbi:hypothetical protein EJ110_NYTH31810 [Nymphaea thermarum]|nr:hypothetical protein EJ110_NYTH31810 [Nymphaea thermarum]
MSLYGRYAFVQYPVLERVFEPLLPVVSAYRSVPFASFVAFFALYLLAVRNPNFSRFIRFNAMQAVVLDVLLDVLVLPLLVQRVFTPGRGIGFKILIVGYNCMFALLVGCFHYCLASCIVGRTPYLPFVAEAAGRQL